MAVSCLRSRGWCQNSGFEYLQLTPHRDLFRSSTIRAPTTTWWAGFRKACADAGVGIASVLPVLRWSGPDEDAREAAVRNWKRVIEITVDLGVNVIDAEFSSLSTSAAAPSPARGLC